LMSFCKSMPTMRCLKDTSDTSTAAELTASGLLARLSGLEIGQTRFR
jgi:hypothetical protein